MTGLHLEFQALQYLKHAGRTHAAAYAHGHANALRAAAFTFDQRVAGQALPSDAIGVADSNRTAVDVELVHRNTQLVGAVQHLHGEGFVEFPKINVADGQAQLGQHLGNGKYGPGA